MNLLIDIAFNGMKLQKLYINVRETSGKVCGCCEEFGFTVTKRTPEPYTADNFYEGVLEMTLLKTKYFDRKKRL